MEQNRLRWLVGGIFLLALAGYNIATYTVSSSQQSTFNILSGQYEYLSKSENPGNSISGSFQEGSASPVSYYIMSSAQFASFQTGASLGAVYSIENVPSASISYGFTTQDDYYFVFRHGAGLTNSTETVTYQRTYTFHDSFRLTLGIFFLNFRRSRAGGRFSTSKGSTGFRSSPHRATGTVHLWDFGATSSEDMQELRPDCGRISYFLPVLRN